MRECSGWMTLKPGQNRSKTNAVCSSVILERPTRMISRNVSDLSAVGAAFLPSSRVGGKASRAQVCPEHLGKDTKNPVIPRSAPGRRKFEMNLVSRSGGSAVPSEQQKNRSPRPQIQRLDYLEA